MERILGITPARGGSKGVPRKNIREICGKPLIAWTIEAAKNSELMTRFIVSTEDAEIAEISRQYGAEVLDRPVHLATDEASGLSVLQHVLEEIPAEFIVILQCTSPVREAGLIDRCINTFFETDADAVATGFWCDLFEWGTYSARRQELKPFFHDDGNVYVVKAEIIREGNLWGEKMVPIPISREQNFEIDSEFDFWVNGKILEKNQVK